MGSPLNLRPYRGAPPPRTVGSLLLAQRYFAEITPWNKRERCGTGQPPEHVHPSPAMVARVVVRRPGSRRATTHWVCAGRIPEHVRLVFASVASALVAAARSPRAPG